jgi:hypothetical protein
MTPLDTLTGWLDVLRTATAEKKRAEEVIDAARVHLEEALGEDEVGTVDGQPVVRWAHVTSQRFDQKKAQGLLTPEQVAECTVASESRRFTLVES